MTRNIVIPEGTTVHINGIPVQLVTSVVVNTNAANVPMITGYDLPADVPLDAAPKET